MRYLSVCSGIEAASVAWHPLGWTPVAFSEIEPFPSAVLAHRYPATPNWGEMSKFQEWPDAALDVLVGGTPCQAFSVAGLRKGLADPRGNLTLTYLAIAARYRPWWVVWENVCGVLSDRTGAFGSLLGGLAELGYGWAYRVLDAQYFGLAQRRRRVFVVGCLGGWASAAAVLFESESLRGHPAPRREARKDVAPTLAARTRGGGGLGTDFDLDGGLIPDVVGALTDGAHNGGGSTVRTPTAAGSLPPIANPLTARMSKGINTTCDEGQTLIPITGGGFDVAHSLRGEGFDASEDGTGRGTPLVPVHAFDARQSDVIQYGDMTGPLDTDGHSIAVLSGVKYAYYSEDYAHDRITDPLGVSPALTASPTASGNLNVLAFSGKNYGADAGEIAPTLRAMGHEASHANGGGQVAVAHVEFMPTMTAGGPSDTSHNQVSGQMRDAYMVPTTAMQVRRLTPRECERLQGFPDGYTAIPWRSKPASECPDGPRYKALGNSMAVPCMAWIGQRIAMVEQLEKEAKNG